jgi:hypothetical protein
MNAVPLRVRAAAELELRKRRGLQSDSLGYRNKFPIVNVSFDPHPTKTVLYDVVDGLITLYPHEAQQRALNSQRRIVAMIAGSQGGKTSFGPWWLYEEIMRLLKLDRASGDYIAATSSYDLFKLKMLPELRNVFEHVLKIGRYWSGDKVIELMNPLTGKFEANRADDPMWARIILRSASSGSGLESNTAKAAWEDEAGQDEFTVESDEAIDRRLTLNQGRKLLTTTLYNLGWVKQQIVDKADSDPEIDLIQFASTANPVFPAAEFERQRLKLPEWKFLMFFKGEVSRPPGMIYSDFRNTYREDGGHKVKPFELSTDWPRFVGIDPGAVNTAMVWLAHDTEHNIYYLYRESLEGGKSTPEHAQGAKRLADSGKERVISWHLGQKSELQQRLDWQSAGVPNVFEPSIHDVESGIDRVIQLLRQFRLYVFDDCNGVLDQLGRYSRKVNSQGESLDEIKDKTTYHYLDALRYVVIGITDPPPSKEIIGYRTSLLFGGRR